MSEVIVQLNGNFVGFRATKQMDLPSFVGDKSYVPDVALGGRKNRPGNLGLRHSTLLIAVTDLKVTRAKSNAQVSDMGKIGVR